MSETPPESSSPEPEHTPGRGTEANLATSVTAYLISGPATFGFLGWLADRWLDTSFLIVVGLLVGMALSLYVILLRYGTH